jgi:hypothetical protein
VCAHQLTHTHEKAAPIETGMFLMIIDFVWPKKLRHSGHWTGHARYTFYKVVLKTKFAITLKRVPRSRVPKATDLP